MKTINEVLSFNLRRLRGAASQAKMAEAAGIPLRTYTHMESGNIPQRPNLEAIAKAHSIPETHLFVDPDYFPEPTPEEALEILARAIRQPKPADPLLSEFIALWGRLDESQRASTVRVTRDRLSAPQLENAVPKPKKA